MSLLDKLEKFKKPIPQEEQKIGKKSQDRIPPEVRLIKSKKLKIGSADLDLLSRNLEQSTGFDISNVHISQDDLWLLYRLKFGKGTRNKRSELLPQFVEAFNNNLERMKKKGNKT